MLEGWPKLVGLGTTPLSRSSRAFPNLFRVKQAKPTNFLKAEGSIDESKVFWDDRFVDELKQCAVLSCSAICGQPANTSSWRRRSFSACKVFLLIPIFTLADGGIGNAENAMSVGMT